ncbi:hypothetical protein J7400_19060 [Shimia sp. R9_2]|nr:hypothetical protein [Shimia sp. R9_2]
MPATASKNSPPHWADPPLDIKQAAAALGIGRSTLDEALKRAEVAPGIHYELRGNRKVFYREHILAMRKVLTECACKSDGKTAGLMPTAPAPMVGESDALLRLRTLAAQKNSGRT